MKRIFVAIDISDQARRKAADYIESLRRESGELRVGWDKPEKLHLTLKFLGQTSENQLESLKLVVRETAAGFSNFRLQLAETGVFPNPRKARVLWVNVIDEPGNLAAINRVLETEVEKIGFPRETRSFRPHLTIARLKEPVKAGDLIKRHLATNFEPVSFDVSEIVIYESKLQPNGSIYQKVSSFRLREP